MQVSSSFHLDTFLGVTEADLESISIKLESWCILFCIGDLGVGKSSFIRTLIRKTLGDDTLVIPSPTYTYYQKYGKNIYHFDLYRVESEEDLTLLGILDILENPLNICLIEWPEILGDRISPTHTITFSHVSETERDLKIQKTTLSENLRPEKT